jgi:putative FmdB family regulatory protein
MPMYEFECRKCRKLFEKLVMRSETKKDVVCPHCGAADPEERISAWSSLSGRGSDNCAPGGG